MIGAFALIVVATMLDRSELGWHWPLDTLAGFIVGLIGFRTLVHGHRFWDARRQAATPFEAPDA